MTGEILPGWQIAASYTYNKNKTRGVDSFADGLPLETRFPKHLVTMWTAYRFREGTRLRGLSIGAGLNGQSRGYFSGNACPAFDIATGECTADTIPFDIVQKGYVLLSGRVAYQLSRKIELSANINNITDRRYYQTVSNPLSGNWYGEGRNVVVALTGRF